MTFEGYIIISLLVLISTTLLVFFIKWKLKRQHLYQLAAKIPRNSKIPSYPLVGYAPNFIGEGEEIFKIIRQIVDNITPPQSLWFIHKLGIVINRPEDVQVVLNSQKCLSKHDIYKLTIPLVGEGIFSSPVEKWKRNRKVIMPIFNRRNLNEFVKTFFEQAEIFTKRLECKCGNLIDILDYADIFFLDVIFETVLGHSIKAETTESYIERAVKGGKDIVMIRILNIFYHYDWIFKWTSYAKEERKHSTTFHKFIADVIETKLSNYRKRTAENKKCEMTKEEQKYTPLIDQLIDLSENGENWTNQELYAEVSTLVVAASDTSATTISFTLMLLGMHQEIQQKCYEEIMQIVGPDKKVEHTDLSELVYLENVIKETMRLFPIGPVIVRQIDDDVEVGGYVLPKGAAVGIGVIGIHYSELYYKNPWKFDPERFSPEEISKRHKYAYLPFSAGPRNCVGMAYAMMSMKTLLAVTLRKYRVETIYKDIKEIRLEQAVTLRACDGYPLRLFLRE